MSQTNIQVIILAGSVVFLVILFGFFAVFLPQSNEQNTTSTHLFWTPEETIRLDYDKCKDLNRSLYINRLFKKDFRLPMCPENYVVLYDESQEIVFIFNENNNENPKILTFDVVCDNSSGQC